MFLLFKRYTPIRYVPLRTKLRRREFLKQCSLPRPATPIEIYTMFQHAHVDVSFLTTWCRKTSKPNKNFPDRDIPTTHILWCEPGLETSPLTVWVRRNKNRYHLAEQILFGDHWTVFTYCLFSPSANISIQNTVLSHGVRSLFGPTQKSSPWGNFSDDGLNQSIKRRLSL